MILLFLFPSLLSSFSFAFYCSTSCFVKKFKRSSIIQQIHDAFCGFTLGFLVFFPLLLRSASSPFVKWLSFARFNHFFQRFNKFNPFYDFILKSSRSIARCRTIVLLSNNHCPLGTLLFYQSVDEFVNFVLQIHVAILDHS